MTTPAAHNRMILRRRKFVHTAAALAVTVSVVAYIRMYHILLDAYPSASSTSSPDEQAQAQAQEAQNQQELPAPWSNSSASEVEHNNTPTEPWRRRPRPPLSSLIQDDGKVIGSVEFLLDFAIVGHPKTGTTGLKDWLRLHNDSGIHMPPKEVHALTQKDPANMVQILYNLPPDGRLYGYKAPEDIVYSHVMPLLSHYWPNTKLVVGVRHPIHWFQSFYNFRASVYTASLLPPPEQLIGPCINKLLSRQDRKQRQRQVDGGKDYGLCTDDARFHVHLSHLSKTTSTTTTTTTHNNTAWSSGSSSLSSSSPSVEVPPPTSRLRHRIFLYEQSGQLGDTNSTRFELWQQDLWDFLGLLDIPRMPYPTQQATPPGPFNICLSQYDSLRTVLLQHGKDAAEWIETHFVNHPDVTVSSPNYFRKRLQTWHIDPCHVTRIPDAAGRE